MRANSQFREKILNNPVYWVEGINGLLYDAIVSYMEEHEMKRKDLAEHLNISPGRVSQILNEGNINFSLEKIVEIAIKVDKFPVVAFEDKSAYLEKERMAANERRVFFTYKSDYITVDCNDDSKTGGAKVIQLHSKVEKSVKLTY